MIIIENKLINSTTLNPSFVSIQTQDGLELNENFEILYMNSEIPQTGLSEHEKEESDVEMEEAPEILETLEGQGGPEIEMQGEEEKEIQVEQSSEENAAEKRNKRPNADK